MLYTVTDIVNNHVVKAMPASQVGEWPNSTSVNMVTKVPLEIGGTYSFKPKNGLYRGIFVRGEIDYKSQRIDSYEN